MVFGCGGDDGDDDGLNYERLDNLHVCFVVVCRNMRAISHHFGIVSRFAFFP